MVASEILIVFPVMTAITNWKDNGIALEDDSWLPKRGDGPVIFTRTIGT